MAEHRAVGLVQFAAQTFTVCRIALGQIDRDHTVVVADHDAAISAREQVEADPVHRVAAGRGILADHGEAEVVELGDQVPLGPLCERKVRQPGQLGVVRPGARQRAAEALPALELCQPRAPREIEVAADVPDVAGRSM